MRILILALFGALAWGQPYPWVRSVQLGPTNIGDTFGNAVSGDGRTYFVMDDSLGCDGSQSGQTLQKTSPHKFDCSHVFVNLTATTGTGTSWKYMGITSYSNTILLSAAPQMYGTPTWDASKQTSYNASLFKSTQGGGITNHLGANAYPPYDGTAMFAGRPKDATSYFILYGADGAPPSPVVDGADTYVYSLSAYCDTCGVGGISACTAGTTCGIWENGDAMILKRAPIANVLNLSLADWQYFNSAHAGCDTSTGANCWDTYANATDVVRNAGKISMTGAVYVPGLVSLGSPYTGNYLMVQWHFPGHFDRTYTVWEWYTAPHPWGPWTIVRTTGQSVLPFYSPQIWHDSVLTASNPPTSIKVVAAADWGDSSVYKMHILDVSLVGPPASHITTSRGVQGRTGLNSNGLVAYWDFDEGTGTTIRDKSGNGHNATVGSTWDRWADDGYLSFTGAGSTRPSLNFTNTLGDLTLIMVFNRGRTQSTYTEYNERLMDKLYPSLEVLRNGTNSYSNNFGCGIRHTAAPYGLFGTFAERGYTIMVCRRAGSVISLFNGATLQASEATDATAWSSNDLTIGFTSNGTSVRYNTIAIYSRALSDDEIARSVDVISRNLSRRFGVTVQ